MNDQYPYAAPSYYETAEHKKQQKNKRNKRIAGAVIGAVFLTGGAVGAKKFFIPENQPSASIEVESPEKQLDRAKTYGGAFAIQALDLMPPSSATPVENVNETVYDTFEVTNYDRASLTEPLVGDQKRHLTSATLDLSDKELTVDGKQESKDGIDSHIQVTFKLKDNGPLSRLNPDAMISTQVFQDSLSNPAYYDITRISVTDKEKGVDATAIAENGTLIPLNAEEAPISATSIEGKNALSKVTDPVLIQELTAEAIGMQ